MENSIIKRMIFVLPVLLLFSCGDDNNTETTISKVYVKESWSDEINEVDLSIPVTLPLNREDAELINEECGCSCSGTLRRVDDEWVLDCCPEFPDCEIQIDVNTGEVTCDYFG